MTPTDIAADREFIQAQLEGLAPQIRQHSILLRAYTAGGDAVKEMKDKVAAILGGQLAMRESLEADLAALDSTDSAA
jgi:hypothetical protein